MSEKKELALKTCAEIEEQAERDRESGSIIADTFEEEASPWSNAKFVILYKSRLRVAVASNLFLSDIIVSSSCFGLITSEIY